MIQSSACLGPSSPRKQGNVSHEAWLCLRREGCSSDAHVQTRTRSRKSCSAASISRVDAQLTWRGSSETLLWVWGHVAPASRASMPLTAELCKALLLRAEFSG